MDRITFRPSLDLDDALLVEKLLSKPSFLSSLEPDEKIAVKRYVIRLRNAMLRQHTDAYLEFYQIHNGKGGDDLTT